MSIVRIVNKSANELPSYATVGASGFDIQANETVTIPKGMRYRVSTGLYMEIPPDEEGQVRPRSGNTLIGLDVPLGTIDSDYRGEIGITVVNNTGKDYTVNTGDRIAQIVFAKVLPVLFEECQWLTDTQRGNGGFGSTGV